MRGAIAAWKDLRFKCYTGENAMKTKMVYRKPINGQDRFLISTTYVKTKNLRRGLETCGDMYIDRLYVDCAGEDEAGELTGICLEAGMECVFDGKTPNAELPVISVSAKACAPEKLRRDVFFAALCGARGVKYDSLLDGRLVWNNGSEPLFHYIRDMNYRLSQYGRTLMALKNTGIYCALDTAKKHAAFAQRHCALSHSQILADQDLPEELMIGEFADGENNRYLLYQNLDCEDKRVKLFQIKLARAFRVYRVNPHNGKQVLVKDRMDEQDILIMPGDGDLLRYQPADEEPFLMEYALQK